MAEFARLDKDKSGELDVKELTQPQVRVGHLTDFGKQFYTFSPSNTLSLA
jgi:hypothetical protein